MSSVQFGWILVLALFIIFLYQHERDFYIYLSAKPPTCHNIQDIKNMLKHTVHLFNTYNIDYFVACGTLLGIVRAGDLIPWDMDADVVISAKEYQKAMIALKHLPKDYKVVGGLMSIRITHLKTNHTMDVYVYSVKSDGTYSSVSPVCRLFSKLTELLGANSHLRVVPYPTRHVFPTKSHKWEDIIVRLPYSPEVLLEHEYGPDWKTPKQY